MIHNPSSYSAVGVLSLPKLLFLPLLLLLVHIVNCRLSPFYFHTHHKTANNEFNISHACHIQATINEALSRLMHVSEVSSHRLFLPFVTNPTTAYLSAMLSITASACLLRSAVPDGGWRCWGMVG